MTEGEIEKQTQLQWHSPEGALVVIANQAIVENYRLLYLRMRDTFVISEVAKQK